MDDHSTTVFEATIMVSSTADDAATVLVVTGGVTKAEDVRGVGGHCQGAVVCTGHEEHRE